MRKHGSLRYSNSSFQAWDTQFQLKKEVNVGSMSCPREICFGNAPSFCRIWMQNMCPGINVSSLKPLHFFGKLVAEDWSFCFATRLCWADASDGRQRARERGGHRNRNEQLTLEKLVGVFCASTSINVRPSDYWKHARAIPTCSHQFLAINSDGLNRVTERQQELKESRFSTDEQLHTIIKSHWPFCCDVCFGRVCYRFSLSSRAPLRM